MEGILEVLAETMISSYRGLKVDIELFDDSMVIVQLH